MHSILPAAFAASLRANHSRALDLFRYLELNADGIVTREEFGRALVSLRLQVSDEDSDAIFSHLDRERLGSTTFTFAELRTGLRAGLYGASPPSRTPLRSTRADAAVPTLASKPASTPRNFGSIRADATIATLGAELAALEAHAALLAEELWEMERAAERNNIATAAQIRALSVLAVKQQELIDKVCPTAAKLHRHISTNTYPVVSHADLQAAAVGDATNGSPYAAASSCASCKISDAHSSSTSLSAPMTVFNSMPASSCHHTVGPGSISQQQQTGCESACDHPSTGMARTQFSSRGARPLLVSSPRTLCSGTAEVDSHESPPRACSSLRPAAALVAHTAGTMATPTCEQAAEAMPCAPTQTGTARTVATQAAQAVGGEEGLTGSSVVETSRWTSCQEDRLVALRNQVNELRSENATLHISLRVEREERRHDKDQHRSQCAALQHRVGRLGCHDGGAGRSPHPHSGGACGGKIRCSCPESFTPRTPLPSSCHHPSSKSSVNSSVTPALSRCVARDHSGPSSQDCTSEALGSDNGSRVSAHLAHPIAGTHSASAVCESFHPGASESGSVPSPGLLTTGPAQQNFATSSPWIGSRRPP